MKEEKPVNVSLTIEKFRESIQNKNLEGITYSSIEFIDYMKSLENKDKVSEINKKLSAILAKINNANIKEMQESEIESLLKEVDELENIILEKNIEKDPIEYDITELETSIQEINEVNEKLKEDNIDPYEHGRLDGRKFVLENKIKELKETMQVPTTLKDVRKEMELILGISIFEGIENENEFAIYHQLDDNDITNIQTLRSELTELLKNPTDNKVRIDEIRMEMFLIYNIDPFTYGKNKEKIDSLEEPDKTRFANLKAKHEELMQKKIEERKIQPKPIKKDPVQPKEPTELVPYVGNKPVVVDNDKKPKKKGRLVKTVKSAKEFYKKHKKAILLVTGIVLAAIALPQVLPSVMYFNSVLWNHAVLKGATQIPGLLHDINLIIGSKIGATYTAGSGIWTLANGTLLNATAAQSGILAALGGVALSAGTASVGVTIAIKNAYRLAKEKIEKRRNKKTDSKKEDKDKTHIIGDITDSIKKGFNKGKAKATEEWEKRKPQKQQKEETEFHRDDVNERINALVNYLISENVISQEQKEELEKLDKEEFMQKFKQIFNDYNIKSVKTENKTVPEKVEFNRPDATYAMNEFVKYAHQAGMYTDEDIKQLNTMDINELREKIYNHPKFVEFETYRTAPVPQEINLEEIEEEKGKGK